MKIWTVPSSLLVLGVFAGCQTQTFEFRPPEAYGPARADSSPLQSVHVVLPKRTVFDPAEKTAVSLQWERALQELWLRSEKSSAYQRVRAEVEVHCEEIELRRLGYVVDVSAEYVVSDLTSGRVLVKKTTRTSGHDSTFGGVDRMIAALNIAIQKSLAEFMDSLQEEPKLSGPTPPSITPPRGAGVAPAGGVAETLGKEGS